MTLSRFHPAVRQWFASRFTEPTEPQQRAWPLIQDGRDVLIAAPTGSGKTLAAFLSAIDTLLREALERPLPDEVRVVYVSPLKALSNDVQKNLAEPLAEIRAGLAGLGLADVDLRAQLRTGDTPAAERQAMVERPPHILVTTPESLYLILTSSRAREMLRSVRTVIVDEIHAVARDKRGSHLALTLERLQALAQRPLQRIGLSATQKPIEQIGRFLTGVDRPGPAIVDAGHARHLDLAIEIPDSPLEAVMAAEVWEEVNARIAQLISEHRTTLVFVNTRRLCERLALHLTERLGAERVTSHHGSMSREKRLEAEQRLKNGELAALVCTASLELGIDIGAVDLVIQVGTTRSIATLLQRVGRAGHRLAAIPKGRLFPLSRDELIECAALLRGVAGGSLDRLIIPDKPLDILAQQIVAAAACEEWDEETLFIMARRAYPYRDLTRSEFDDVVQMLAEGFTSRRGRRGAHLHYDGVNKRIKARRGARLAAIMSGGAIPDLGDFRVVLEPTETFVGTLNEDFAIESVPGEVFQLGNTSYLITKVESRMGVVRVADARGQPPTLPFWLGEAPGRTDELSAEVAGLRKDVEGAVSHQPSAIRMLVDTIPGCRKPPLGRWSSISPRARRFSASCRRRTRSSWSASSTRAAACSWCCTRRLAAASTGHGGWRCVNASAARSTSSCRPRRPTTRSSFHWGRTTASRSRTSSSTSIPIRPKSCWCRRCSTPRCSPAAGAGTPRARSPFCGCAAASKCRPRSSAWNPRIWLPRCSPISSPVPKTSWATARSPTIRSCSRRSATAWKRRWTSRG